jgi:hypothetical protein
MARAICSRKDGTPADCKGKGALRRWDGPRGKRSLNEKENWRRGEWSECKVVRQWADQVIGLSIAIDSARLGDDAVFYSLIM